MADGPEQKSPGGRSESPADKSGAVGASSSRSTSGADNNVDGGALTATVGHGGGGGGRHRRPHKDLSTGSIPKHLWGLAWPQWAENVLNIVDQMIDLVWAGRLEGGFRAIAGLGVAQSFVQVGQTARGGFDQALRAMVSRAVGANNIPLANHIAQQAITLSVAYSIVMVAIGIFLTEILLNAIGVSPEVKAQTATYMRIQFIGTATMAFRMMSGATLQASGDMITPLKATTVTRTFHIVATPFIVFGWGPFPELGLAGVALANVLSHLTGAAMNFYVLFKGKSRLHLTLRGYRIDFKILGRLLKIGIPASLGNMERSIAQLILLRVVAPFGDIAVAGFALSRRVEMFANFGGMGVGNATGVFVGQNLGAKQVERAKKAVLWGLAFVTVAKFIVFVPLFIMPVVFINLFTSEPEVVALTTDWLRILGVAAFFLGFGQVFQQSFNIAGDTVAVTLVSFVSLICVEVPMGIILAHTLGMGPLGIAWAHLIGMSLRAALFVPVYFWGRWTRIKVL